MREALTKAATPAGRFSEQRCPLCDGTETEPFLKVSDGRYYRCGTCDLRFLDPGDRPSSEVEYRHYLKHENHVDDPRYRKFLSKLSAPLIERLDRTTRGLDYGCGPGPALAAVLREAGHEMALFDPFFAPDAAALEACYDFVTCTETVEHFHRPKEEFELLRGLVRAGGWLTIMTCFQTRDAAFADWHYRKDPTHVAFFRESTFRNIARRFGWECQIPCKDVVLMRKPSTQGM